MREYLAVNHMQRAFNAQYAVHGVRLNVAPVSGDAQLLLANPASAQTISEDLTLSTGDLTLTEGGVTAEGVVSGSHLHIGGLAPAAPVNGDLWLTGDGFYYRASDTTFHPLTSIAGEGALSFTTDQKGAVTAAWEAAGAQFLQADADGLPTFVSLSGDATLAAGGALTLKDVGPGEGSLETTAAQTVQLTLDSKGRITAITNQAIAIAASQITSGQLPIARGGTGADDAVGARANLGLAIGTDVPSVTGGGASGTWGINISGNAASATTAGSVNWNNVTGKPIFGLLYAPLDHTHDVGDSLEGVLAISQGGTGADSALNARANLGLVIGTDVPAPTGGGASGTWGIDISGNAATATSATTAGSSATAGRATNADSADAVAWDDVTGKPDLAARGGDSLQPFQASAFAEGGSWLKDKYAVRNPIVRAPLLRTLPNAQFESLLGLPSVPVSTSPASMAFDGTNLWVVNTGDDTVSKINVASKTVLATYQVGDQPTGIVFDGYYIWVTNKGSHTLSRIDTTTGTVTPKTIGGGATGPHGIAYDGNHLWVANETSNTITRLDRAGVRVSTISSATLGAIGPTNLAFDGTDIWVVGSATNQVKKIQISTETVPATVTVGSGPRGIAFDGVHLWVTNETANTVSKITLAGGVAATIPMVGIAGYFTETWDAGLEEWVTDWVEPIPASPRGVVFDGTSIWVTNANAPISTVVQINPTTNAVLTTISLSNGDAPSNVAFDGSSIWVACASKIVKIDYMRSAYAPMGGSPTQPFEASVLTEGGVALSTKYGTASGTEEVYLQNDTGTNGKIASVRWSRSGDIAVLSFPETLFIPNNTLGLLAQAGELPAAVRPSADSGTQVVYNIPISNRDPATQADSTVMGRVEINPDGSMLFLLPSGNYRYSTTEEIRGIRRCCITYRAN